MDKSRSAASTTGIISTQMLDIEYPKGLIEQYLLASTKFKKIERVMFKRFAPSVADVQAEFQQLAYKFEESGIMQYAAMCHIGNAKCESYGGSAQRAADAYIKAARDFALVAGAADKGCQQGALHCYHKAEQCVADDGVLKAALLREMKQLQPHLDHTSSLTSPAHCIHDMEIAAAMNIQLGDYRGALQQFDDIVDNIYERRKASLYQPLLRHVELMRLLLLIQLNLPPARQSPSHIKLIAHYYTLSQFNSSSSSNNSNLDEQQQEPKEQPDNQQYALAEIICAWVERKMFELKQLLLEFNMEFRSLNSSEQHLLRQLCDHLGTMY